jgi:hypothetical protein
MARLPIGMMRSFLPLPCQMESVPRSLSRLYSFRLTNSVRRMPEGIVWLPFSNRRLLPELIQFLRCFRRPLSTRSRYGNLRQPRGTQAGDVSPLHPMP